MGNLIDLFEREHKENLESIVKNNKGKIIKSISLYDGNNVMPAHIRKLIEAIDCADGVSFNFEYHDDNGILINFEDDSCIFICDDSQSCCESRYITCDDNLSQLTGDKFLNITEDAIEEKWDDLCEHQIQFLTISSDKNFIKFCSHNEHNGYYGGISLNIVEFSKNNDIN